MNCSNLKLINKGACFNLTKFFIGQYLIKLPTWYSDKIRHSINMIWTQTNHREALIL